LRAALYQYHRQGLDLMPQNPEQARQNMLESLRNVQKVVRVRPGAAAIRAFFEAKSSEFTNAFATAPTAQKQQAFDLLTQIDPTNRQKYEVLMQR